MHWLVGVICCIAVALTLAFAFCRLLGLWAPTASWIRSNREEKVNLTRSGIYTANGFMVKSDADDHLGEHFQNFSLKEPENSMTAMTIFPIMTIEASIPPQPLRPAPGTIIIPPSPKSPKYLVETQISDGKNDSYYICNISSAGTKTLIQTDEVKQFQFDQTSVDNFEANQNDWSMEMNLNNYDKPMYKSTNPFLEGESTDSQSNPFDPQTDSEIANPGVLGKSLSIEMNDQNEDITPAVSTSTFRRAVSCDSVTSDTSVEQFESSLPIVTGQLCLSLRYFRINSNDSVLAVNVIEARNLPGDSPDTYVGIFATPDYQGCQFKSRIYRKSNCPSFNETFLVDLGKIDKKLHFHLYSIENDVSILIGETELSLQDASSYKAPVTTWLTLTDSGQGSKEYGELMISLSYLPTAERLTLIVSRARRLPNPSNYNVFVKVYLQKSGKKVGKKRSSVKRNDANPSFNEAFIFSVPPHLLKEVELRVTLFYVPVEKSHFDMSEFIKVGHVILSYNANGKPGNHWTQMMSSLRKPVTMWHSLRKQYE